MGGGTVKGGLLQLHPRRATVLRNNCSSVPEVYKLCIISGSQKYWRVIIKSTDLDQLALVNSSHSSFSPRHSTSQLINSPLSLLALSVFLYST